MSTLEVKVTGEREIINQQTVDCENTIQDQPPSQTITHNSSHVVKDDEVTSSLFQLFSPYFLILIIEIAYERNFFI